MCKKRLDIRDRFPSGMEEYLSAYGWHFNKRLCEYALSKMKKTDVSGKESVYHPLSKEKVDGILSRYGIDSSKFIGYDYVYVMNMLRSDFTEDEGILARFTQKYLCDVDGYDEIAMTRFYADSIGKGEAIPWEDVY